MYNNLIDKEDKPLMWSAYHASQLESAGSTAMKYISALYPLFHKKSASPEMILHGMKLVEKTILFLNPDQIPVLVVNQPLYALPKKLQWTYLESLGENKFVGLLGGLHIEMVLWATSFLALVRQKC